MSAFGCIRTGVGFRFVSAGRTAKSGSWLKDRGENPSHSTNLDGFLVLRPVLFKEPGLLPPFIADFAGLGLFWEEQQSECFRFVVVEWFE